MKQARGGAGRATRAGRSLRAKVKRHERKTESRDIIQNLYFVSFAEHSGANDTKYR